MSEVKQQKTLEELRQILATTHTIAVVGRSGLSDRPSNRIPAYLQSQGYRIIPVNPRLAEAPGEKAYPSLREVPVPVDVVQIFRRAEEVPPIVEDAIAIRAKVVWMQPGIVNEEAVARAGVASDLAEHTLIRVLAKSVLAKDEFVLQLWKSRTEYVPVVYELLLTMDKRLSLCEGIARQAGLVHSQLKDCRSAFLPT